MKRAILLSAGLLLLAAGAMAQELYVATEPASNMPANSLGIRFTSKFFRMEHEGITGTRVEPELMWGINKKLMVHLIGYASNQMQPSIEPEGGSIYVKYRFYSADEPHQHFRLAAYVKGSVINNPFSPVRNPDDHSVPRKPYYNEELDLEGGASGVTGGIIATQLLHKLALSGTAGYNRYLNNVKDNLPDYLPANAVNYSLSAGYLLLPRTYRSYEQTNLNLYVEFLGKTNLDKGSRSHYVDIAPAVQLIFNSTTRLDVGYRTQLGGSMPRNVFNTFMIRLEHNIFNLKNR